MNEFNINAQVVSNTGKEEMPYALNLDGPQFLHVKVMLCFSSISFAVYFYQLF